MKKKMIVLLMCISTVLFAAGCSKGETTVSGEEPEVKSYAVLEQKVEFFSESLGVKKNYNIFLPPGYSEQQKYPVLYMLHGRTGDEDAWTTNGLFEKAGEMIAAGRIRPLIIVTPDVDNSAGFNWFDPSGPVREPYDEKVVTCGQYSDYLVKDLVSYIDAVYSTERTRAGRYIGGCSLGGLAALHNAFLHTDLFSKVGGHSPALILEDAEAPALVGFNALLYSTSDLRSERDPIKIAQRADLSDLSVYLDCGSEDDWGFFTGSEELYSVLQERQVESQYHLNDGTHSREYWNAHIEDYLLFYAGIE